MFCDIERLNEADRALAADVDSVVSKARPDIPILNRPNAALRRYDLLATLHQNGLNPFRAYRLTETSTPERFPVFLRYENDHTGATTGLLKSQHELDRAIVRVLIRGHDLRDLIIVEFIDTSTASGIFTKYSAYRVGNAIVPRGAELSRSWVVKFGAGVRNPAQASLSFDYVRDNPHEHLLVKRFDMGRIGYGRIDYSMLGDSMLTWEINTNPTIMSKRVNTHPTSLDRQELFLARVGAAFDALETSSIDPSPVSLSDVDQHLRIECRQRSPSTPSRRQRFGRKYKRWLDAPVRAVEVLAMPLQDRIIDRWRRSSNR